MDYFIMKQSGIISIPKGPGTGDPSGKEASVRIMANVSPLKKFDYIAAEALVSGRLKELLEQYLPEQDWMPCVFVDPTKKAQETFWFLPPLPYAPEGVSIAPNGIPASIYVKEQDFAGKSPGIFRIRNPKGTYFTIVHLSIAESILRRGICGLEFLRMG